MVDFKEQEGMFQIHPEDQPKYGTPGKHSQEFQVKFKDNWIEDFELIKSIKIDDESNEVLDTKFYGDILDPININEQDQYKQLMDTFLSRKDKRKLSRYKGFKSFSDRIYGK